MQYNICVKTRTLAKQPNKIKPTAQAYAELQQAFDHFNIRLFEGKLPQCLLTLQREKKTCGYFSAQRFGDQEGHRVDEIALNPAYFAVEPLQEIMQTIVHEMVHLWQFHFGKPGRGRYHNDEWADKMQAIGLMPSSTGAPGGRRTGDHMADYMIPRGLFDQACQGLLGDQFKISWYDRFPPVEAIAALQMVTAGAQGASSQSAQTPEPKPLGASLASQHEAVHDNLVAITVSSAPINKSNRIRYTCNCKTNIWGKPALKVQCLECQSEFEAEECFSEPARTALKGE